MVEFLNLYTMKLGETNVDMRDAFFSSLCGIASTDQSVIILSDDHAAFRLKQFAEDFPDQYINVGISEQNAISLASGMALCGYRPFVYGISTFVTGRCFEQINLQLSAMNLPVVIVGVGAGFTYSVDGPTHHALQDIILMNSMPNMTILDSSDPVSTADFANISYKSSGPVYVRIEKGEFPKIYEPTWDFSVGAAEIVKSDQDFQVLLITSGHLVHEVLDLTRRIPELGLLDLYRIKPLNVSYIMDIIKKYDAIIVAEEQFSEGGIGSIIATIMVEYGVSKPFSRLSVNHHCFYYSADRNNVREQCGVGLSEIETCVKRMING